jgi:hypothetical protein
MQAVSLTPHACTNNFEKLKSYAKQRWYEKKFKNACSVNDTACDTACTIDERFERPWQPLQGRSIKTYIILNWPTPPLKKYINLKGLPNKTCSCMRCHWHRMHDFFSFENRSYLGEFEAEFKKALARESGAQEVLFDEKNRRSKISWHFTLINLQALKTVFPCSR